MKDDNITMNERLAEMFGIPKDAFSATLRMRAGVPPILTVTRMIYRTGQLEPTRQHDRYRLVPVEKFGAGETAPEGHNVQGKGQTPQAAVPLEPPVGRGQCQPEREEPWRTMETAPKDGTEVELLMYHLNRQYAKGDEKLTWEQVVVAKWIDFNGGGWTWHGMCGEPQGWRPLPPNAICTPVDE